ncbi:beta-lactamase/transpeptidase-like protein [Apodospora peruviana]|uniref:Beta-lactamase/transpeptidase-like protein n=1 Tax=Apodospora peruviana TaxID=516989 RepID=A0AAE0LYR7_9PEZI|nr:beta-lactamase/transpeptidase-like protein [Apodospora peruviana]
MLLTFTQAQQETSSFPWFKAHHRHLIMHISLRHALALVAGQSLIPGVFGDFSGPSFPPPRDLTSDHSLVKKAWEDFTTALEARVAGNNSNGTSTILPPEARNITFSIGLFSLHDPDAANSLQFHHTSPEIAASTQGTNRVDGNSIYRVASITKVFTVLAGLLTLSDDQWERPLSDILAPLSGSISNEGVLSTPWDKITMRALAAQLGGVPRDGFPNLGEIALQMAQLNVSETSMMAASGLPPFNASDPLSAPPCLPLLLQNLPCTAEPYLSGVANRAPTFLPWSSPAYSNNGFVLLGLALSAVTNQSIANLFQENILNPLGMSSTFSDPPPTDLYPRSVIIPSDAKTYPAPNGIFVSSGGIFSTTTDLARFGTGILNSSLLTPDQTRRWLKPVSFTSRLQYAVGAPWEILRYVHRPSGKVTDMYAKSGDAGVYSSWLVLVPEYGTGFSILSAGSPPDTESRAGVVAALADAVSTAILPAIQSQAGVEAGRNFGGTYSYTSIAGGGSYLNSTLVLKTEEDGAYTHAPPGLVVEQWVSNGTDVLSSAFLGAIAGPGPRRLLPSVDGLDASGQRQVAFRLVGARDSPGKGSEEEALFVGPGMASPDWLVVDASTYFGAGLSLFVFDVDGDSGEAIGVTMPAYRVRLARET